MTKQSLLLAAALILAACGGDKGSKGEPGPTGTPGPSGTPSNAPTLSSISPYHASEAMEVTITGTGFSTTAAENVVYFGGTPGNVISATATEIVVNPANGGFSEEIDVTVATNDQTSNSLKFFLGFSGDLDFLNVTSMGVTTDLVRLADGTIVVSSNNGRIFKVSPAGVTAVVEFSNGNVPINPEHLAKRANGNVLVLDGGMELVWSFNPVTNDLTVFRLGNYVAAAVVGADTFLLRNGNVVDKVAADGTFTASFHTFVDCTNRGDMTAVGNELYVAGSAIGANANRVCWVDTTDNSVNGTLLPAVGGEDFTAVQSVDVEGADLLLGGSINGVGDAVAALTPDLANGVYARTVKTPALNAAGSVAAVGGGAYLVTDGLYVMQANATEWTVKSGILLPIKTLEADGAMYAINSGLVGTENVVFELLADGTYRVASSSFTSEGRGWSDAVIDGDQLYVSSQDEGVVAIDLGTGAQSLLIDRSAISDSQAFARDAAGNFYILDSAGEIAKYDAQGGNETLAFATGFSGGFLNGVTIIGTKLYGAGGDLRSVDLVAGGASELVMSSSLTGFAVNSVVAGKDGKLVGCEVNSGALVTISPEGFVAPYAETGTPVTGLQLLPDGRILVAAPLNSIFGSGQFALLP